MAQATGHGHRLLGHCRPHPHPWSWEPAPLGQRESGRRDVEKRANSLYLAGLGQCSLLVGCMCFGDRHKWAIIFFYMAHVQTLAGCEHMHGFLRGLGRDSHRRVPSCLQSSSCPSAYTAPPTPVSATIGLLPTDSRGWRLLTGWAALWAGKPANWLRLR